MLKHVKQEAFCIARVKGATQAAAAIIAGYSKEGAAQLGSRLENHNPKVKARLHFLRGESNLMDKTLEEARHEMIQMGGPDLIDGITSKWLCLEFYKNAVLAREQKEFRDANNALVYISKLSRKMPSEIPFPPGSPHPIERVDNRHRDDHNYLGTSASVSQGVEVAQRLGSAGKSQFETGEDFGVPAPQDIDEDNEYE